MSEEECKRVAYREQGEREDEGGAEHVEAEAQVSAQHQEAEPGSAVRVQQAQEAVVDHLTATTTDRGRCVSEPPAADLTER